jgi:hypothetical protein
MYSAVRPIGMTPRPRLASQTASQTVRASSAGAQISKPRSPVNPVRDTMTGTLAIVVRASPK